MSDLTNMLDRNQEFAAQYEGKLAILPRYLTMVLTCADARVDPAHFLGLELGDALVFRNTGARVTEAIELEVGVLWTLASKLTGNESPGLALAIMQHTDCGVERLVNPELRNGMSHKLGVDGAVIDAIAIADHTASIQEDIERLRQSPLVPNELVVSGHIYDVEDGLVREVVPAAALHQVATI